MIPLLKIDETFKKGYIVNRPNRFTLIVNVDGVRKRAYLANPGRLSTIIEKDREVLLIEKESKTRKTSYDAFAVKLGNFYVTLKSAFANEIFKAIIERRILENFQGYTIIKQEKLIKGYGRIDFVLANKAGKKIFIEVKSCTHAENGIAKFPDAPTERGRRHIRALIELAHRGNTCYLFFIVQRPDVDRFTPFKEIDPNFANLVAHANYSGVKIHAVATRFHPPYNVVYLTNPRLTVIL